MGKAILRAFAARERWKVILADESVRVVDRLWTWDRPRARIAGLTADHVEWL
jgi:hypothetical protein